jgi:ligand-binding sensor domain-containing protein
MQNRKTTVWASTDEGFWVYFDNLWNAAGKNLPKVIIKDFYLTDDQKEMYLATYGSGVWKAKIKRRYRK